MRKFWPHFLLEQSPEGKLWIDQPVGTGLVQGAFAWNQSLENQLGSVTLASAATITPSCALTFVTGTTQVANITPPLSGMHVLILVFTDGAPGAFLTTGNIKTAYQPIQNRPIMMVYDPISAKYWVNAVV